MQPDGSIQLEGLDQFLKALERRESPLAELFPNKNVYGIDISTALERCAGQAVHLLERY